MLWKQDEDSVLREGKLSPMSNTTNNSSKIIGGDSGPLDLAVHSRDFNKSRFSVVGMVVKD
jgi:hypothetical protein